MIVSVNWLKEYVDVDMPVAELATLIGARLVEIEEVIDYGAKYKDVVVAKVVSCTPLEGSDHLNVTRLDDDQRVNDIERDEEGYVQVVCGASNVKEGMLVAWLPPKTTVPETYGSSEPFVLDARKLRGVMSNGMIASAKELALYDEHEGILEIGMDVQAGTSFAELLALDDVLLDIENKSLTHRPDVFGVVGFAREVAGIQRKKFQTPDWLLKTSLPESLGEYDFSAPAVNIDDSELSARYQGVIITDVDGSMKTPLPLQTFLARVGMRPVSAVVDLTNYLMLETGQPLHAFDYDKLAAVNDGKIDIHVRAGRENETLLLLDGRTITLTADDIVIANGETAVALAGAMGGAATEVDEHTKTIFLESATFNLYSLRATQMRHGIFSEAITRFTKGQPAELTTPVLLKAISYLEDMGARQASKVVESYPVKQDAISVEISLDQINATLGTALGREEVVSTLENVGFKVEDGELMRVTAPYWRSDIHIPEDLIEEIGRLRGYDFIDPILPTRDFTAVRPKGFDETRTRIRRALARAGANEVLTYSFIHGDVLTRAMQKTEGSYRITNSISPSLQYYRQTLTPSLLGLVHPNIKQGYDELAIYELNKTHPKAHGMTDEGVPSEVDMLGLVIARKVARAGAAFYEARRILDFLGEALGLELIYASMEDDPGYPVTAPFEHRRAALVTDARTDTFLGIVGEYKKSVSRAFKLPEYTAGFELGSAALHEAVSKLSSDYVPLSKYPGTSRDICFQVKNDISYESVVSAAKAALVDANLETSVEPIDIYRPIQSEVKNITIRINLTSHKGTLTSDEISQVTDGVVRAVAEQTGASVV